MTREDAAVILVNAFKLPKLDNDYLAAFSDAAISARTATMP